MNLGEHWGWEKRKLGCRIREETGNPAYDDIRDELAKLTGVELPAPVDKKCGKLGRRALEGSDTASEAGPPLCPVASTNSLLAYQRAQVDKDRKMPATQRNIYKKYFKIPRGPPAKVVLDLHRNKLRAAMPDVNDDDDDDEAPPPERPKSSSEQPPQRAGVAQQQQQQRPKTQQGRGRHDHTGAAKDVRKESEPPEVDGKKPLPFKKYRGDLFSTRGEYMGGIIYQSRHEFSDSTPGTKMRELLSPKRRGNKTDAAPAETTRGGQHDDAAAGGDGPAARKQSTEDYDASGDAVASLASQKNASRGGGLHGPEEEEEEDPSAVDAKRHCADSIAAWSTHSENAARLAEEGAVTATIVLSKDENAGIRRSCATAFKNMSQHPKLCEQLVAHTAVPVISDLGVAAKDMTVSRDCSLALVNLTNMHGLEARLVEDGIVIALMSLMNQHEDLADVCSRGLFNLTCVDGPYQHMERVVKAFISLASSTVASVKHVCAAALCNLSDIKAVRPRIVEEGVVQVIGVLARGAEARTRRVCAIILHLLASTRQCRADMVSKGAVQVLYSLSADVDTITLHYIASAIIKLAMEDQNLPRLVHEGGVTALCNICLRCPHDAATTKLCASALSLLSQQVLGRQAIVQEGCVPALVTLVNEASDDATIRNGLSAFTNLLMDAANHEQVLSQGGIAAVIGLCRHSSREIREACALALFNFSRGEASRDESVTAAAVPAIIALSRRLPVEPVTRMRCAATLGKFASVEQNVALMVEADVVPAFIDMLESRDPHIVKHCCAALCRLAHEGSSAVMIAEGAVPHVIAGCGANSDAATRQACCAVLSAVSAHEPCREPLCDMGALEALMALAQDRTADDTTRLRCAVAFANLSNEPSVQRAMVDAGIVPVVADLSNSYCEENQLYCARALCNLASHEGREDAIVSQGGVAALMMIAMVRAVSHFTKQVCAKAIGNLLATPDVRTTWLPQLAKDGLVQAVSVLSRLPEEETMQVCATIFCTLSAEGAMGRRLLTERKSTLLDVFGLMRSHHPHTQLVCGKTTCNLVGNADAQAQAVDAGAVHVLAKLGTIGNPDAEVAAAEAFFLVAGDAHGRATLLEDGVLPVLVDAAAQTTRAHDCCLRVLAHLAWWRQMRLPLLKTTRLVESLVELASRTPPQSIAAGHILHTLTYMSFVDVDHRVQLVDGNVVPALARIYEGRVDDARSRAFVAAALRSLTETDAALNKLVADGAVRLLCEIVCSGDEATLAHCAAALCSVARRRSFSDVLVEQGVLRALPCLATPSCYAFAASIIHVLSLDPTHREALVFDAPVRTMLKAIASEQEDPSTITSCAHAFYWLSRCTGHVRHELAAAGLVPLLIRLSRHDDDIVAASCREALKNMSSGSNGGIEEGTVSTLIAMTLNGGTTNHSADAQSTLAEVPAAPVVEANYEPTDDPQRALDAFQAYTVPLRKLVGGTAGAGPPPPEPPDMDVQDTSTVVQLDNNDNNDEDDSATVASMMFSKMAAHRP